jgi:hypothetical protein
MLLNPEEQTGEAMFFKKKVEDHSIEKCCHVVFKGRAITEVIVVGLSPWRPGFHHRSANVRFVVDKLARGRFSSEKCVFPCLSFH